MLLLEVVPSLASSQAAGVMSRLDKMRTRLVGGEPAGLPALQSEGDLPALPGPALTSPAGLPGTRRLDMDVAEYEYVDTGKEDLYHSPVPAYRPVAVPPAPPGHGSWSEPLTDNEFVWSAQPVSRAAPPPLWSLDTNSVAGRRDYTSPSATQDYDDIDYTSGGLVTFHTALTHSRRR